MPCVFALVGLFFPRIALVLLWFFTPLVNQAINNPFLACAGVIFMPLTTLMYVLAVGPLGETSIWGWILVIMGLYFDLRGYVDAYYNRGEPTKKSKKKR